MKLSAHAVQFRFHLLSWNAFAPIELIDADLDFEACRLQVCRKCDRWSNQYLVAAFLGEGTATVVESVSSEGRFRWDNCSTASNMPCICMDGGVLVH